MSNLGSKVLLAFPFQEMPSTESYVCPKSQRQWRGETGFQPGQSAPRGSILPRCTTHQRRQEGPMAQQIPTVFLITSFSQWLIAHPPCVGAQWDLKVMKFQPGRIFRHQRAWSFVDNTQIIFLSKKKIANIWSLKIIWGKRKKNIKHRTLTRRENKSVNSVNMN